MKVGKNRYCSQAMLIQSRVVDVKVTRLRGPSLICLAAMKRINAIKTARLKSRMEERITKSKFMFRLVLNFVRTFFAHLLKLIKNLTVRAFNP